MRRRLFLAGAGAIAVAPPTLARAQAHGPRIGAVHFTDVKSSGLWRQIEQRLRELNYIESQNIQFEFVELHGRVDRYDEAMNELVRRNVDIIVTLGPQVALKAAVAATKTIPIVMIAIDFDPLKQGYVENIAHPSGNVTGVFFQQIELAAKRMQIVQEACPGRSLTVFWDKVSSEEWAVVQHAASGVDAKIVGIELSGQPYDYEAALTKAPLEYRSVLSVLSAPAFFPDRARIADFAIRHKAASMFTIREYADAGGLMTYGANLSQLCRRAADYVDRIVHGSKTQDLPIEQPTKFEFVFNMKTAKAIGFDPPPAILLRADEVIE